MLNLKHKIRNNPPLSNDFLDGGYISDFVECIILDLGSHLYWTTNDKVQRNVRYQLYDFCWPNNLYEDWL